MYTAVLCRIVHKTDKTCAAWQRFRRLMHLHHLSTNCPCPSQCLTESQCLSLIMAWFPESFSYFSYCHHQREASKKSGITTLRRKIILIKGPVDCDSLTVEDSSQELRPDAPRRSRLSCLGQENNGISENWEKKKIFCVTWMLGIPAMQKAKWKHFLLKKS